MTTIVEAQTATGNIPATPIGLVKHVLRTSRALGAVSFTYHITPAVHSPETSIPRLLFSNAWPNRNAKRNIGMRKHIERIHGVIISEGLPTNYLAMMRSERLLNPKVATAIENRVVMNRIVDEYIIPVYGPYKIEGCMCFGFKQTVESLGQEKRNELQALAAASHIRIVSSFRDKMHRIHLSNREIEVLQWIALGKSKYDIATILGIKTSTIDSYSRRIYSKFGVHTKVGAVLAGISTGKIGL